MTPSVPTHDQVLAASASHHELQRVHAAATVRRHLSVADGREDMLDCLGLSDLTAPEPAGR